MSRILHLATIENLEKLEAMVAAYHAFEGIESDAQHRISALRPLLEGSAHGAIWMIGPRMAPVGYVAVSFGWSIEMGGMDGLVFTAGVGENSPPIRSAIAERLSWLGLEIDEDANASGRPKISTDGSRIACYVVPTNEELMIARHSLALV